MALEPLRPSYQEAVRTVMTEYGQPGPVRALQLLLSLREEDPFAPQVLAQISAADPNQASRLKRSTHAHSVVGRRVVTLRDAIRESGYRPIYCVSVFCALASLLGHRASGASWLPQWRRLAITATFAQVIADSERAHVDEAYPAALLQGVGDLLMPLTFPALAAEVTALAGGPDVLAVEQDLLGYTRRDLAAALARRCDAPASMLAVLQTPCSCGRCHEASSLCNILDRATRALLTLEEAGPDAPVEGMFEDEPGLARGLAVLGGLAWLETVTFFTLDAALLEVEPPAALAAAG